MWQVQGSNLRRRCRLIYSQIPLATRATCRDSLPGNDAKAYLSPDDPRRADRLHSGKHQ